MLSPPLDMAGWLPKRKKYYPHFDRLLRDKDISALVTNKIRVASNSFFPLLLFEEKYKPFTHGPRTHTEPKIRLLRYASRRDAYIYEYYRSKLVIAYETELTELGISDVPIAYRKLKNAYGRGKCNIDFAKDAFEEILKRGDAIVITMDISKYFEHLAHEKIYSIWCRLLGAKELSADHEAVYRSVTKYRVVDRDKAYQRIGILTYKGQRKVYRIKPEKINPQLCSIAEFREKICGKGGKYKSLIEKNSNNYGIPQGLPISDLIANFYLIDFDCYFANRMKDIGGYYRRYCDDLIYIIPNDKALATELMEDITKQLQLAGPQLKIKDKKTRIHRFSGKPLCCKSLLKKAYRFEYLGFQFDGRFVRLRDATTSAFYRKVTWAVRHYARKLVARFPGKDLAFLEAHMKLEEFLQKFGRKYDFATKSDVTKWNFWTYVRRAEKTMGKIGLKIPRQVRNYKKIVRSRMIAELAKALSS